jgi:hypothetical protein
VCLARHHEPPITSIEVDCCGEQAQRPLAWRAPDAAAERAFNNRDEATRDAAYIVSLAAVERDLGLVALLRAETRTGADYYVGTPDAIDIENAYRLEVSGVDSGDKSELKRRLSRKIQQAREGQCDLPAFASVVGFRVASVLIREVRAA